MSLSRRDFLRIAAATSAGAGVGSLTSRGSVASAAPIGSGKNGKVVVRTSGGAYEEGLRKGVFEPFAEETGIQVIPYPTTPAKVIAMVEAGSLEIDVLEAGDNTATILQRRGALIKLDLSKLKRTNPEDITPAREYYLGENNYATVMVYNKEAFPRAHPTTWAEFWDTKSFPGPRTLEHLSADIVNLEFALLADGVPVNQLYPIDLDRAFKKLAQIRPSIVKWWDTGAVGAEMLANKHAVLGSLWHTRVLPLIDAGAPLAIEWNQSMRHYSTLFIPKGAPNVENAYKYIDYALSPKAQAAVAQSNSVGPANRKAFEHIDAKTADRLPTSPKYVSGSFTANAEWWIDNRQKVADRWQEFLLGG